MAKRANKKNSKTPKPSLHLSPGDRLGKYRLAKRLGQGGYCEVFKARDTVERIWVALKIPNLSSAGKRDNQAVLREVSLIARLRHPHIMPLKNADIIDGHAVLATELSVGTLADRSKPMGLRRILYIISQVLDGLAYAHQHRLMHCDVAPGNIFLFPDGRAALGDFGIGLERKGRMVTIDEFGTPGYVAPEQAYGRPTYRSDCFAVALILYEYLTGFLPRWPFRWPMRGHKRLQERVNSSLVGFLHRALSVDPHRRFADADQMLTAFLEAMPKAMKNGLGKRLASRKKPDWRKLRRQAFTARYKRIFPAFFACTQCGEPLAESMSLCPWCGSESNRFDTRASFSHVCSRCHKGVLPEWRFCPWCYGPGFKSPSSQRSAGVRYNSRCRHCKKQMIRFMRYCPWCRRKVIKPWRVRPLPGICTRCGWSVDSAFWNYCPWCQQSLTAE